MDKIKKRSLERNSTHLKLMCFFSLYGTRREVTEKYHDTTKSYITVGEVHAILSFSRRSENSDWTLQWWSMGKNIFKHK